LKSPVNHPIKLAKKHGKTLQKTDVNLHGVWTRFLGTNTVLLSLSAGYKCNLFPIFDKDMAFFVDRRIINRYDSLASLVQQIGCPLPIKFDPKAGFPRYGFKPGRCPYV
jgi:hypothetical protein